MARQGLDGAAVFIRLRNTGDRRNQLLDAAEMIIVSRGLDSAHRRRGDRVAGVAKGTFYLYFQSKKQIVSALQERVVERQIVQQQRLLM
jgi:AcrR family transcriptional regulator